MTDKNNYDEFSRFMREYQLTLNSQQQQAVRTTEGANLLIAVPGSGKTTVLVARLGYMIICKNIPPQNILAMTYTTAAAADMKSRFAKIFGNQLAEKMNFRTINSVCYEIIRFYSKDRENPPFELISDSDRKALIRKIYIELAESFPCESEIQEAESEITYIKNMMLGDEKIKELKTAVPDILNFYRRYDNLLKAAKKMDYDDQMKYSLQIMLRFPNVLEFFHNKFRYICVDEAQDTSKLQHTIIRLLSKRYGNIFMVGDEDQSIYGFRAAYPKALMDFRKDYSNSSVLFMENNYRSTKDIVDIAAKFISHNTERYDKKFIATREKGTPVNRIQLTDRSLQYGFLIEKIKNKTSETAVLYRDNDCAIPLIDSLIRNDIPYRTGSIRDTFFSNRTVEDIKAFVSLSFDHYDTSAFMQIYYKCGFGFTKAVAEQVSFDSKNKNISVFEALKSNTHCRYSAAKSFEKFITDIRKFTSYDAVVFIEKKYESYLQSTNTGTGRLEILKMLARREPQLKGFMQRLEILPQFIQESNSSQNSDAVIISTIHSSKGLEYDTVYIMDIYDGILPSVDNSYENRTLFEEERRLFYVGLTRAKNNLNIISFENRKSTFADEILPLTRPENPFKTKKKTIDEFVTHNGIKVTADRYVMHSIYGMGKITEISLIDNDNKRHSITVRHTNGQTRSYELETLLLNNLLKFIDT